MLTKGGAIVIQDVEKYIEEANRQLHDKTYKKCNTDLTQRHNNLINHTIDSFKNLYLIDEQTSKMLRTTDPKTPKFYTLPKIHKPNNPGRPVISSINCHTAKISKFVDYHLQDLVKKLPSYIKDTTDFINKTKDLDLPDDSILVTMDVSALYTNIPNDEGIEAVKNSLKESTSTSLLNVITTFLTLILTLNNFIFNGIHYLQTKDCAMGTKCAPTYANIFMGEFEEKYIYPKIKDKSCKYLRYIDDIFMVWKSSQDELNQFIKEINEVHPSIKFTTESSKTQVNFLDTTIQINDSKLTTKTFKKPTDRSAYLHNTSYHPNQLKKQHTIWPSTSTKKDLHIRRRLSPIPTTNGKLFPQTWIPKESSDKPIQQSHQQNSPAITNQNTCNKDQ